MYKLFVIFLLTICAFFPPSAFLLADDQNTPVLTLSRTIELGVANHASVKEATENLNSAVFESNSAKADMFLKASANYSYTRLDEEPFMKTRLGPFGIVEAQVADTDQYHWDVTVAQPLFTGFALTTRYDTTKLGIEVRRQEKKQAILDIIQKVKTAYFNVLFTKKILLVTDDVVTSLKSHESDAKRLFDHGIIRYNDLLSAKVALGNALQDREKVRAGTKMAVSELNMWLGYDINRKTNIEDIDDVFCADIQLEALLEEGMNNRPVLQVLRLGLKTLENVIRLEKSAYYPEVSLVGRYQQDGDNPGTTNNDFTNDYNASVTVQAKWTFFEWGKTQAKVKKVHHDKRALIEKIKGIEESIKLDVKNAYLNLKVARKNIGTARESLGQAKENWRITNLQYKQQVSTSSEVLDARTYLTQADTNYWQALYGYMITLAQLERAVGRI